MPQLAVPLIAILFLSAAGPASGRQDAAPSEWIPAPGSIVNPIENRDLDAWEAYKTRAVTPSRDEGLDDPVLKGAIDIHAHFGPDAYRRQWDAFEIAKRASARGMRGLVLKNHWSESAGLAYLVRKYDDVPGLEVFGGLVLNSTVGGINPQAIRYFAEVEGHYARVVWMPTHDAEGEVDYLGQARPYVIVSRDGTLLPQVLEALDLIKHYGLTLATGHVAPAEMVQIVDAARARGIDRIIITHPGLRTQSAEPTVEQLKRVTGQGAYAEVVATELSGKNRDATIATIRAIGPAHCIIASDSGLAGLPSHPDALVRAARILRAAGFSEPELDAMFKDNPARVLGLPVLADH